VFVFDLLPFDRVELPEGESADGSQLVARPRLWWVPFGVDVDQISPQAARDLVAWVTGWKSDAGWPQGLRLEVRGHADATGSSAHNATLSMNRARAVADALSAEGIPATALVVSGAGSAEPPPAGISPRRVEVRLVWGR
jgi:outer membrane protein OmpA-like peptidoglycan-associated protein